MRMARIGTRLLHTAGSNDNPIQLHRGGCTVHLLGTMHIAEASAVAARDLIHAQHAKGHLGAVFLELDAARFKRLKNSSRQRADESLLSHAMSIMGRPNSSALTALVELGLTSMYKTMHRMGFASGVEFKAAIEAAEELGVPIVLGDQEMGITLTRLAHAFADDLYVPRIMALAVAHATFPDGGGETRVEKRVREAFEAIAAGDVERGQARLAKLIDQNSVREIIRPMREFAPCITRAILDERDCVMTENLVEAVVRLPHDKRHIVGIVGLAHVDGIARGWEERRKNEE